MFNSLLGGIKQSHLMRTGSAFCVALVSLLSKYLQNCYVFEVFLKYAVQADDKNLVANMVGKLKYIDANSV